MSLWAPAPPPPTALGRHRRLSTLAGVHVSPICLGAMSIGDKWSGPMGESSKDSCFKLLDAFYDAGGNFIDTANNYQDETSEEFLGEWMETRGIRDQIVIATKVGSLRCGIRLQANPVRVFSVLVRLQERAGRHQAAQCLRWKQHEVAAHFGRAIAQEVAHFVHRHSLRSLGKLLLSDVNVVRAHLMCHSGTTTPASRS